MTAPAQQLNHPDGLQLNLWQVDAFAERALEGNPAAVIVLREWLPDALMQAIAVENNLSETAFTVPLGEGRFRLRWFTPAIEVDLCGHATLAAGHVLLSELGAVRGMARFETRSGELRVSAYPSGGYAMDLPSTPYETWSPPEGVLDALGMSWGALAQGGVKAFRARFGHVVLESEEALRAVTLAQGVAAANAMPDGHLALTAPGDEVDFAGRLFAPGAGIPEDPVTGSAFTDWAPYWADELDRQSVTGRQVSHRPGQARCTPGDGRVTLEADAITIMRGVISL